MQKVLVIAGCTAVGKSSFALELSKEINMEIVSADAIQVYKGLDIGTSKPTKEEQAFCKHHLIDIISPHSEFDVYYFQQYAKKAIDEISSNNKLPVIVGGTGLYVDSILYDFDFKTKSKNINKNYEFTLIFLNADRNILYKKINLRVESMIKNGLVDEIKALRAISVKEGSQSMQAIGYKEINAYLNGEIDLSEAIELIKRNTRNYAKRQITWFKHNNYEVWDINEKDNLKSYLIDKFAEYKKTSS